MNREALDRWCERGILGLVLAVLVYTPLAFGGRPQPAIGSPFDFVAGDPFLIAEWLTLGATIIWIARLWLNPGQRLLWPPICWAVLAFAIYGVIRYLTADIEYIARQELVRVLVYALIFFIILNNLHRQELMQIIGLTMIFLAMMISFWALFQFLAGSDLVWHLHSGYAPRGSGTYISPNHLGGFLEMILPLGLSYMLVGRFKPLIRVLLGYASLVMVAAIGVTLSRGSWVSTAGSLMVFFAVLLLHRSYRLPALLMFLVVAGAGVYVLKQSHYVEQRFQGLVKDRSAAAEGRTGIWPAAINVWRQNVWWGVGPAHFDYRFRQFRPEDLQARPDRTHNDFLNTLVDWGIVGTALVASAWILLAFGIVKTWRFVRAAPRDLGKRKKSNKLALVLGASVGLVAILIHSTVDFNMHIPANAIIAVTLMALITCHLRFATERFWFRVGFPVRIVATMVLIGGLVYLGQQSVREAAESIWLERASLKSYRSPEQVAMLKRAFAVEPRNPETALAIGTALRTQSAEGGPDYRQLATEALSWFQAGIKLNPLDPYPQLGAGGCLDWLDRKGESPPYFSRAEDLDPNGYFTIAMIGRHYVALEDYAAAREWFRRSLELHADNDISRNYLEICQQRLLEGAKDDLHRQFENATRTTPPPQWNPEP
jgi:O-antigen ligase